MLDVLPDWDDGSFDALGGVGMEFVLLDVSGVGAATDAGAGAATGLDTGTVGKLLVGGCVYGEGGSAATAAGNGTSAGLETVALVALGVVSPGAAGGLSAIDCCIRSFGAIRVYTANGCQRENGKLDHGHIPSGKRPLLPFFKCLPRYQPSPNSSSLSSNSTRSSFDRLSSSELRASKSSVGVYR
jgi:hypothetical protein